MVTISFPVSAVVIYGRVNLALLTLCVVFIDSASCADAHMFHSVSKCVSFSQCEVLRGHGGFQAAAALPQFALVAVQGHLLQG